MMDCKAEFPSWVLLPKAETGASAFLTKYPESDGRGTIIAVLDTGVDPGAKGMRVTSDGRPKVIECIDASGAGDVDMSTQVEAEDGCVKGLTGRKLILPNNITNPSGKFRVGVKRAYSLYSNAVKSRIVDKIVEEEWEPQQKQCLSAATKKLQLFETGKNVKELVGMDKLEKDNLDAQVDVLSSLDKKFRDAEKGPVYDILSYHDGETWHVLIDNTEKGLLDQALHLRPYSKYLEFAPLTKESMLNVSVNVFDNGDIVQIVAPFKSHGTHVACIAAANFPDSPEENGLAPGAQIVSIEIGDARVEAMETGTSLVRAMTYIMQRQMDPSLPRIDVINMSYGEFSQWSNSGRVGSLIQEVIEKYGVVFVVSAGNDGPALSTVGSPPDIQTSSIIGVGAYVSPEMMMVQYSSLEKLPETAYTWSSRGPTMDGHRGVSVCAPGAAITTVSQCTLESSKLMNGTSMASPQVCGAVALLISRLKSKGIPFSPFSIKRSIINTAKYLPTICPYAQGHGLLQVETAFEHLDKFSSSVENNVTFSISCIKGASNTKGIYLRQSNLSMPIDYAVAVEPVFLDSSNVPAEDKINFNLKLSMTCTETWVKFPKYLHLASGSRQFLVNVDPSALTVGPHSAYIRAFDSNLPEKGALFEVPVTVIKAEPSKPDGRPLYTYDNVVFNSGSLKRHFYQVPENTTYGTVRFITSSKAKRARFLLHIVQVLPMKCIRSMEKSKMFTFASNEDVSYHFPVQAGHVVEVCIAKWWMDGDQSELSYSVRFDGVMPSCKEICIHAANCVTRLDLFSHFQINVFPEIKLNTLVQNFRPTDAKLVSLGERDVIPNNRCTYELQLTYNFNVPKASDVTPNFPLLSDVLYESEFESQLWMLYNSHKEYVASGDAFANKWTVKLDKDDYVLRLHIRYTRRDLLDKMMDLPLVVSIKLSTAVTLDSYSSFASASTNGKKMVSLSLPAGKSVPFYIATASCNDKFNKNAMLGQYLQGTMTLVKDEGVKKAEAFVVKYFLMDAAKREKNNGKKSDSPKQPDGKYQELLLEYKISCLSKMDATSAESKELLAELTDVNCKADKVDVRLARLTSLELDKSIALTNVTPDKVSEALELTEALLADLPENDMMALMATKQDNRILSAEQKKSVEKKKTGYIDTLLMRGIALCIAGDQLDKATEILFRLLKVLEPTDSKLAFFGAVHADKMGHYGRAVKYALQMLDAKPNSPEVDQFLIQLYSKLGWQHCEHFAKRAMPVKYPSQYELL